MSSNVISLTRALGMGLLIATLVTGCGSFGNINPTTVTPSVGTEGKQDVPPGNSTEGMDTAETKALPPESVISASRLDEGIKAKKTWQIVDVREPREFAMGHVPQAINIPLGSLATEITKIVKDKDREVILICHTGDRAFSAWQSLVSKGFDPQYLKVLVGGMEQWNNLGSEEVTESIGGC